jgi:sterol-4alpha-carboxylate 3-dehydrogenase (decarboxylating)
LVYTSSSSVAFDGGDVINGTEDKYGQPSWFFSDHYAQTKGIAEKLVLAANGKNGLLTAAIRPANIYGPGDRHAFPEIAAKAKVRQAAHFIS